MVKNTHNRGLARGLHGSGHQALVDAGPPPVMGKHMLG